MSNKYNKSNRSFPKKYKKEYDKNSVKQEEIVNTNDPGTVEESYICADRNQDCQKQDKDVFFPKVADDEANSTWEKFPRYRNDEKIIAEISRKIEENNDSVISAVDYASTKAINSIPDKMYERLKGSFQSVYGNIHNVLMVLDSVSKSIDSARKGILDYDRKNERIYVGLSNQIDNLKKQTVEIEQNIKALPNKITLIQDAVEDLGSVKKSVKSIQDDVGSVVGKTASLIEDVNGIREIMESKDFTIRTKLPVITTDEQDLAQMGEYAHSIIEQLVLGAVWYARKRDEINNIAKEREQFAKKLDIAKQDSYTSGKNDGREALVMEIISKIGNINDFMESKEGLASVLVSILKNEGVKGLFDVGEEIEIDKNSLKDYEALISIPDIEQVLQDGAVRITFAGAEFNGNILAKAECIPCLSEAEKARREAEEKNRREAEEKARRGAEQKVRREAEEKARREAEEKARREAEQKARREAEQKARREAEQKARREAEQKARREAEQKACFNFVDREDVSQGIAKAEKQTIDTAIHKVVDEKSSLSVETNKPQE